MKTNISPILAALAVSVLSVNTSLQAQDPPSATSDIVGFITVECLPNSDTIVSVPFHFPADHQGFIAGAPTIDSEEGTASISFKGSPTVPLNWASGLFDNHYVRLIDGSNVGRWYEIISNTANAIVVYTNGDDLSSIAEDNVAKIIEFWTLDTLFPPDKATTAFGDAPDFEPNGHAIVRSTGTLSFQLRSLVLVPFLDGVGINRPSAFSAFISPSNAWLSTASGNPPVGTTRILPETTITIRHPASVAYSTNYLPSSVVEMGVVATSLDSQIGAPQDNFVAIPRPVPIRLSKLGLESGLETSTGILTFQRKDILLVKDNSVAGINKPSAASYFRIGSQWHSTSSGTPVVDTDENPLYIQPSSGLVIRRAATTDGSTNFWVYDPNL